MPGARKTLPYQRCSFDVWADANAGVATNKIIIQIHLCICSSYGWGIQGEPFNNREFDARRLSLKGAAQVHGCYSFFRDYNADSSSRRRLRRRPRSRPAHASASESERDAGGDLKIM